MAFYNGVLFCSMQATGLLCLSESFSEAAGGRRATGTADILHPDQQTECLQRAGAHRILCEGFWRGGVAGTGKEAYRHFCNFPNETNFLVLVSLC